MSSPFWYLSPGKEVPHDITHPDRAQWKSLDDQGTEPLASRWPVLTIQLQAQLELPDLFATGSKRVISQRLRALIERFHVNAEYLPVKITNSDGSVLSETFSVLHPLERIDCIDFGTSDFDQYGSGANFIVARFRRLVFRPEAIGDRAVFRPQRYSAIFASEEFRETALREALDIKFYPPDGRSAAGSPAI